MVELRRDGLEFSFPDVHPDARLRVELQRTLRIPDDGESYPLPPGLGTFPMRHVDDFGELVPEAWVRHGGVMLPMYQSEALWIRFVSPDGYPFAVKVATGKVNAVTGEDWSDGLHRDPQDYLTVPEQPWLDGYAVEEGTIRQFVAMPLGAGYSVEEQMTGAAEHGGIQLVVHPLKAAVWKRMQRKRPFHVSDGIEAFSAAPAPALSMDMGLAPGGRMTQHIYDDERPFEEWDTRQRSRCFVHLANALVWQAITGQHPPYPPLTAEAYTRAGFPWFEYYDADRKALRGATRFRSLKSVLELGKQKGEVPLPENTTTDPGNVVRIDARGSGFEVREGRF